MKQSHAREFKAASEVSLDYSSLDTGRLHNRVLDRVTTLYDDGLHETADLFARLADRLMRQERLIIEERERSADLERQLAVQVTKAH